MKTKRRALAHVMLVCGLEGPLLPFAVGNNWTYQVTEAGVVVKGTQ